MMPIFNPIKILTQVVHIPKKMKSNENNSSYRLDTQVIHISEKMKSNENNSSYRLDTKHSWQSSQVY